ncbi:Tetraprenyl-beta-curcumene synthase [Anoxybacillus sp. BCO1]|nr:Tetraprenyl-beta-curcumene synthase [Anoxybacillus sp. BCO1]
MEQDDGGYLHALVDTCQQVLAEVRHYHIIAPFLHELASYYCDLQVHKHVKKEERIPRLKQWFAQHEALLPKMEWYEFSACSGSTLGIFCLVAYACTDSFDQRLAERVRNSYFPYVQGLHILLDYLIDQEEDRQGGDLNFCFYYPNEETLFARLCHFVEEADRHIAQLPHREFHRFIHRGCSGYIYRTKKCTSKTRFVSWQNNCCAQVA